MGARSEIATTQSNTPKTRLVTWKYATYCISPW